MGGGIGGSSSLEEEEEDWKPLIAFTFCLRVLFLGFMVWVPWSLTVCLLIAASTNLKVLFNYEAVGFLSSRMFRRSLVALTASYWSS